MPQHSESGASLETCLTPHSNTLLKRVVKNEPSGLPKLAPLHCFSPSIFRRKITEIDRAVIPSVGHALVAQKVIEHVEMSHKAGQGLWPSTLITWVKF